MSSPSSDLRPSTDLRRAAHEGIRLDQFCEVFLTLILQIGKLPRELKTLTSGHTADNWLNQMQALSFGWDISSVINTLVRFCQPEPLPGVFTVPAGC